MSLFDEGRALLAQAAQDASENITFTPASGEAITLPARIGEKLFKTASGGVPVNIMARRFIVRLADLTTGRFPLKSDTITWRNRRYKLAHPDGGTVWRWHGNDATCIAIYTMDFGNA